MAEARTNFWRGRIPLICVICSGALRGRDGSANILVPDSCNLLPEESHPAHTNCLAGTAVTSGRALSSCAVCGRLSEEAHHLTLSVRAPGEFTYQGKVRLAGRPVAPAGRAVPSAATFGKVRLHPGPGQLGALKDELEKTGAAQNHGEAHPWVL